MHWFATLLYLYLYLVRLLFWLSVWQQREYRLDRFTAFLKSAEGRGAVLKIPNLAFNKQQLKRPHPTLKAILNFLFCCLLIFSTQQSIFRYISSLNLLNSLSELSISNLSFIVTYTLTPLFLLASYLPLYLLSLLITNYYHFRSKQLVNKHQPIIIGITGSYGKTTTKQILSHLLKAKYTVWSPPFSFNTPLSLPKSFVNTYQGQQFLVVEFAAYKIGEIKKLTKVFPPQAAIITGLAPQHLEIFGSLENIIKAKSELLTALTSKSPVAYNDHQLEVSQMVGKYKSLKLLPATDSHLISTTLDEQNRLLLTSRFSKTTSNSPIATHLVGDYYLSNIQTASLIAQHFEISPEQINHQLESFTPQTGFIRYFSNKNGAKLIWDGRTANPHGFSSVIDLAAKINSNVKILLTPGLVDLGEQSALIHRQLAQQSLPILSHFIHTTPNQSQVLESILGSAYHSINNSTDLEDFLDQNLNQNSLLVVEGRLHPSLQAIIKQYFPSLKPITS